MYVPWVHDLSIRDEPPQAVPQAVQQAVQQNVPARDWSCPECPICLQMRPVVYRMHPCRHGFCADCFEQMSLLGCPLRRCFICRRPVEALRRRLIYSM